MNASSGGEQRAEALNVIAETTTALSRCQGVDEVCTLLGSTVQGFNQDACVVVSMFDEERGGIRIRALFGFDDMMDSLLQTLGKDPRRMTFSPQEDMTPEERQLLTSGRLERVPDGIHAVLSRKIPRRLCKTVERLLGVDGVYVAGFALDGKPYGGLLIMPPSGETVRYTTAIEALVAHAAVVVRRRQAEEALRESEAKFRALTMSAQDAIIMVDAQGAISLWNRAAEEVFGYTREEALGEDLHALLAPEESRETMQAAFSRFQRTGQLQCMHDAVEMVGVRKDGTRVPIEFSLAPVELGNGWHAVAIVRDITERVRAEKERRELEEQLQVVRHMESIGQLAGGVAHDFNNLLTPIMGYAQLIQEELPAESPLQGEVEEILDAADRARDLVRQLLAFGRRQMLRMKPLDLNRVVSEFESFLRRTIREDIHIRLELAPSLGRVRADPGQIEQILMNLAANAQDAMPEGGEMTIRTDDVYLDAAYARERADAEEGPHVMLSLSDTGMGMSEEVQEHLFEPFFTTKEVGEGTGMGLATVYGIVKQHGGNIYVYSEEGEGSTFKVYLPCKDEGVVEEQENHAVPAVPAAQEAEGTLLVVEDDDMVRDLARRILEKEGYDVLAAHGGEEALELLERYDGSLRLLVTDVVMPAMNGEALSQCLRQRYPHLRVLYISGYSDREIGDLDRLREEVGFLSKPFSVADLQRAVHNLLD